MANSMKVDSCHASNRRRAPASGISLTANDAAVVKGMLARGDRAHDVASWFGVNPGRIADIATGKTFTEVAIAKDCDLPPPGPYVSPLSAQESRDAIAMARQALDRAEHLISRRPS